ncbi:hypothetical protein M426DRAFT_323896 [Hypoxylon sp. CI-4A]|nr:hypothetical protein M426DRAFT_323896 [Hypoxylon sp. CI-4A]
MSTPDSTADVLAAQNLFQVNGLVAVVTGGGSGIGLMITKALARNGAKVYILGRRLNTLQEAAAQIGSDSVIPLACDVTSKEALQSAAEHIRKEVGYINLLVCNSGIGGPLGCRATPETTLDEFVETNLSASFEDYTNVFAVNTAAVFFTTMSFLKLLDAGNKRGNVEQKSQVIAISSIGSFSKVNTGGFAYAQSKAACTHLVKQLSVVLPQWDIRANAVCPGIFPSDMVAAIYPFLKGGQAPKNMIPVGRAGDDQDMGGVILYLASRAGGYNNGAVIVTDGGRLTTFPSTF